MATLKELEAQRDEVVKRVEQGDDENAHIQEFQLMKSALEVTLTWRKEK